MSASDREFDLVVFGATGFTGQFVVEEVIRSAVADPTIKWAIAGRTASKLAAVLETASNETGVDVREIGRIEADVSDEQSLRAMCGRTRLVVNTVGPYRFYGQQVVKACLESGTHHVDISGEPQYLEKMQLLYSADAEAKGVYIVGACGWDSIPCDLGVQLLKKNFDGQLESVETFVKIIKGPEGLPTNFGTWQSAIHGFANFGELKDIRRRLYSEVFKGRAPVSGPKLERRLLFRSPLNDGWSMVFPGSDRSVVQRTQQYKYERFGEPATQIQTYFTVPSFFVVLATLLIGGIFAVFASFGFGRTLLERYPQFFSFGQFKRGGPTRQQIKAGKFELTLIGKGRAEQTDTQSDSPTKTLVVRVKGADPGYVATSTCLVQAGITILKDKLPMPGGVLTPGAAFDKTNIYDRLARNNLTFEVSNVI